MAAGGHFGFGPLTEFAHTFTTSTQANFFIQPSWVLNPLRIQPPLSTVTGLLEMTQLQGTFLCLLTLMVPDFDEIVPMRLTTMVSQLHVYFTDYFISQGTVHQSMLPACVIPGGPGLKSCKLPFSTTDFCVRLLFNILLCGYYTAGNILLHRMYSHRTGYGHRLLWCLVVIWYQPILPICSRIHSPCGNCTIVPVAVKLSWRIWIHRWH